MRSPDTSNDRGLRGTRNVHVVVIQNCALSPRYVKVDCACGNCAAVNFIFGDSSKIVTPEKTKTKTFRAHRLPEAVLPQTYSDGCECQESMG